MQELYPCLLSENIDCNDTKSIRLVHEYFGAEEALRSIYIDLKYSKLESFKRCYQVLYLFDLLDDSQYQKEIEIHNLQSSLFTFVTHLAFDSTSNMIRTAHVGKSMVIYECCAIAKFDALFGNLALS